MSPGVIAERNVLLPETLPPHTLPEDVSPPGYHSFPAPLKDFDHTKPIIEIVGGQLPQMVDQAEQALLINKEITILVVSHDIGFVSRYIKRVVCLNKTLLCHQTAAVTPELIQQMYGIAVRAVQHEECI